MRASETILRDLERDISTGALVPGDTIDETSLAKRFDISRTPAREALIQLAASGLVELRPRHGAVVRGLNADEAVAMMESLAIMESEGAALAAQRMQKAETLALADVHAASREAVTAQDSAAYIALNARFHGIIYTGSRNDYLAGMILQTRRRMAFYHASSLNQKARLDRSWREHGAVLAAIRTGDDAGAREAMRNHILSGGQVYADLVAALKGHDRAIGRG